MIVWDADDFGVNRILSDQCQSHDCRDKLDEFHYVNPAFKATLFAIPAQMTYELAEWCKSNNSWVELAVHGIFHSSNYECADMTYEEFDEKIAPLKFMLDEYFVNGFKAPGWQISDGIYQWLRDHAWWVADKSYNNERRPKELDAYVNYDGNDMKVWYNGTESEHIIAYHGHTWDVGWNGVYEDSENIKSQIDPARVTEFKFVSEIIKDEKDNVISG